MLECIISRQNFHFNSFTWVITRVFNTHISVCVKIIYANDYILVNICSCSTNVTLLIKH